MTPGSSGRRTSASRARVRLGSVTPLRSLIGRIRALPAGRADALLAVVLLAEGASEVVFASRLDPGRVAIALALLAAYTLGAHTQGRHLWAGVAIACAFVVLGTAVEPYDDDVVSYITSLCLFVAAPVLFGQVLRNRTRLNQALYAKAERAERERAAAANA